MLSTPSVSNSRPVVSITAGTASSVAAAAAATIQNSSQTSGAGTPIVGAAVDKTEINEAVTKVLQGYDWTLVPIATK